MDIGDLFGLVRRLDPRRRREPPPVALEVPAVRPRIATPPAVVPPLVTATGPAVTLAPDLGLVGEAPPMPRPTIGLIGGDVDPRTAGMDTRPRIADPLEYRRNRVAEMGAEPPRKMGRWEALGRGALRGFGAGGLGGALFGAGMGAVDPDSVARMRQGEELDREQQKFADLYQMSKAQTDLEGAQLSNDVRAAQIPYLLARPGLEDRKLDLRGAYDAWRMKSGDRKADTAEEYIAWRMANGDRRAETAEGQLELRREYVREIQPRQFERRQGETERHNQVSEGQGDSRVRQGAERVSQGWARVGQGQARVEQGAARLGQGGTTSAAQQKEIDKHTDRAVKALREAEYFDGKGDKASADLKRREATDERKAAEAIAARPAPRVAAPRTAPVAEEDFVNAARQRLGAGFDEGKAREAYRRRYGR